MSTARCRLLLVLCLFCLAGLAQAQVAPVEARRTTFWGFLAVGVGGTEEDSTFFAAGLGAGVQYRSLVLMARIAAVGPEEENRMEDFGLLAGWGSRPGRFHVAFAAGVGTAHDSDDRDALSIPVEAQVTWRFSRLAGLGLRGFLSLNEVSNFGGLTIMVETGRLR